MSAEKKQAQRPKPDLGFKNTRSASLWRYLISLKWLSKSADIVILAIIALTLFGAGMAILFNNKSIRSGLPGLGNRIGAPLAPLVQDQLKGVGESLEVPPESPSREADTVRVERNR